ncbi:MAG: T9SS type A sorting domain-containing protein [Bacteroidia bacterium]
MKKQLLFASISICSFAMNAQITITSADMPVAGNSYIIANDTAVSSYGTAGANQTWNFSTWASHSLDTNMFSSASGMAGASFFPTATIGIDDADASSFMKVSSSVVELLGFYGDFFGGGATAVTFVPAQKYVTLPSTYQTNYTGTYTYEFTFPLGQFGIDSVKIKSIVSYTSNMDGWGTLTTPSYSAVPSLRQFYTEMTTDTTFGLPTGTTDYVYVDDGMDTSYTYRWFSNAHTFPLAEITFNIGDTIYSGSYLTNTLVGINEFSKNTAAVSAYPNPAINKLNFIGIDSNSYLIIFDVNGKIVDKTLVKKNTTVDVSAYNNGVYFYTVAPLNGKPVSQGKFVVEK